MVEIKRFEVWSVGVMWGILSAIGGLIGGIIALILATSVAPYSVLYDELGFGWIFSGMMVVIAPLFYGVVGFISGIIGAALYNLFQRWVGGVKVEIYQKTETPE